MVTEVVAVILARGGSKGIPGKNLRPLGGVPLLVRGIQTLQGSGVCARIVVSTDDSAIAEVARAAGAEVPFLRPAELAADDSPSLPALEHAVRAIADDAAGELPAATLLYQVTSPFCRADQIREAVDLFAASEAHFLKSVVAATEHPAWMGTIEDGRLHYLFVERAPRRQELPACYRLNGAISMFRTESLLRGDAESGAPCAFVMDARSSLDLDDAADWARAEALLEADG